MKRERRAVWGWVLYDWANSAFATSVMAGFFPIFFKKYWSLGADVNTSTALLGFANSTASLLIAFLAPILGAIADQGSSRKGFLVLFAYLGALMTGSLFMVKEGAWTGAILFYALGSIGFYGANVFYDSLLPVVASKRDIDFVSGLGYGLGYLGGGLLFLVHVCMTVMPSKFGLPDAATAMRFAFLSVAVWWGGFTVFTVLWVREERPHRGERTLGHAVGEGLRQLFRTFRNVRGSRRSVFIFLLAYWFYIDGVDTIIRMAVDYGLSLGFDSNDLIISLLIVQFIGFPASLIYGRLGQWWDVRKAIYLGIGCYLWITIWGVLITKKEEFFVLAVWIGLVQGGVQALSRSFYTRLIPERNWAQYFGFYNMIGKFAAILGPVMIGMVGLIVRGILMPSAATPGQVEAVGRLASRWGLASVSVLFLTGAALLYFVDEEKQGPVTGKTDQGNRRRHGTGKIRASKEDEYDA